VAIVERAEEQWGVLRRRAARLVIELDSRAHHHQRRREMAEDRRRDRRYRMAGWIPIRVMWEEPEPDDPTVAREVRHFPG